MSAAYPAGVAISVIGQPVVFHVPAGVEIPAVVVEDGAESVVVELPPDIWDFVDEMWVFGLDPKHRGPGKVSGLGPVRVELRPAESGPLYGHADLAATLVERSAADPGDRFLDTTAWRALSVTETVRDEGVLQLRSGFRTRWHDGRAFHPLLDDLTAFFTVRDVPIDRTDGPDPMLSGEGDGANGSWLLTVKADETTRVVTLQSVTAVLGAAAASVAAATDGSDDAVVDSGRLIVTHHWPAPVAPLDESAFATALGDHLTRTDALLAP